MTNNFLLVSAPFPSGVAWVLNFLLELDILVYRGQNISDTWQLVGIDEYILRDNQEELRRWCPALSQKVRFKFQGNIAVHWSHEFPSPKDDGVKTILLTRDGRDAVYSQYRRDNVNETFLESLSRRDLDFGLPRPQLWALFNFLWSNSVSPRNLCQINFEKIKTYPDTEVKRLLKFLAVSFPPNDVRLAIEASSQEKAKQAEKSYIKRTGDVSSTLINRRGKPGEWKEVYTKDELKEFSGFPAKVLKEFGYDLAKDMSLKRREIIKVDYHFNEGAFLLAKKWAKMTTKKQLASPLWLKQKVAIFLKAIGQMGKLPFLVMLISRELFIARKFGQSSFLLDQLPGTLENKHDLAVLGKLQALHLNFLKARSTLTKSGDPDWEKTVRQELLPFAASLFQKVPVWSHVKEWQRKRLKEQNERRTVSSNLPKQDIVRKFAQKHNLRVFVETGTYRGDMIWAVKDMFDVIFSVELDKDLFSKAKEKFRNFPKVKLFCGDSGKVLPTILKQVHAPTLFWLDSHYSGGTTAKGETNTPIMSELKAILANFIPQSVILIDDARLFTGQEDYPTLKDVSLFVKSFNSKLKTGIIGDVIAIF